MCDGADGTQIELRHQMKVYDSTCIEGSAELDDGDFVLQMMDFGLQMRNFVLKPDGCQTARCRCSGRASGTGWRRRRGQLRSPQRRRRLGCEVVGKHEELGCLAYYCALRSSCYTLVYPMMEAVIRTQKAHIVTRRRTLDCFLPLEYLRGRQLFLRRRHGRRCRLDPTRVPAACRLDPRTEAGGEQRGRPAIRTAQPLCSHHSQPQVVLPDGHTGTMILLWSRSSSMPMRSPCLLLRDLLPLPVAADRASWVPSTRHRSWRALDDFI